MPEHFGFNPDEEQKIVDFPFKLKYPEALDISMEIAKQEHIAKHLDTLKNHHRPTYEHCLRVAILSTDLGLENGLEEYRVHDLSAAGSLHDLGKCTIEPQLLDKNSSLTPEEKTLMRTHVREGVIMLSDPKFERVRALTGKHHEKRNGDSYPRSGTDEQNNGGGQKNRRKTDPTIDEDGALMAAADVFDALAVKRPYNPNYNLQEIEKIMRHDYSGNTKYIDQILSRFKNI